ncbi:acyl carrier protein [Helicobacter pylori]
MGIDWLKDLNFKSSEDLEAHENESYDLELERLKKQHGVIACVLNAKMENKGLEEYQCILDNNFLEFASGVDSLKEKEIALLELQEIKKELQLVASYPSLFQKNMVAVGGGFSAGKSSFLNHLLGLKLPYGVEPVTAIPTYCLKGEREVLMGRSQNGGMVELPDFSFDHKTLNAFGFDLKSIMTFMILSSPTMLFKHLCFIDTPGYDAPNQGYTGGDRQASKEYLNHAKHILWFISCERGIEFLGIGVYSSERYQEIKEFSEKSPVFDSLEKFLTELNKKSEKQNEILKVLYKVGLAYEKAIKEDLSKFKRYQDALHSIKLDLMQKGFDDFSDARFNKIESLKKEFSEQERSKRENLAQLNQVINLFKKSIDKVFNRVSAFTWEKYKEEKYKEENDDEENDEENYREFEEIKKMVLYFRDCWMFVVEQLDGKSSQTELQKYKGFVSRNNKLLQLEFSMKNLLTLRQFKDTYREWYSKLRQLNEAKEVVSELRDYWLQELPPSAKDLISCCSTLLKLDYSLENLQKLRRFKDNFKKDYQKCKRSR